MCAFGYRGKRTAYDNIAVGSIAGIEKTVGSAASVSDVSPYGGVAERGGISNISVGNLPGVEDTDNATADKLTSDGEVV